VSVHWAAGMMRWRPHQGPDGVAYPLHHLHPLRYDLTLPANAKYSALDVEIRIGFAMHTFTRETDDQDDPAWRYADDREARIFDTVRYQLSKCLPNVVRTLDRRKCYHAKTQNFLTLGEPDGLPAGQEYQVYFDLRRLASEEVKGGRPIIQLIVQSAYANAFGQAPRGRRRQPVGFHVLISSAVAGRKPGPRSY
jgi:hypothetical protein